MFQKFEVLSSPEKAAPRIAALRQTFGALGIDAVAVPRADEYLGEYVPDNAERLAWLTSFTGSAGLVLVMPGSAHLFVDGRYTSQAAKQADGAVFQIEDLVNNPLHTFLRTKAPQGLRLGLDAWTWTSAEIDRIEAALSAIGGSLVLLEKNPVDAVWSNQPQSPLQPASIHPLDFAGKLARDKISEMQAQITETGADGAILSDPSSVAWTFNIRGADLPSTPHPLCRAIIPAKGKPKVFIDARKTGIETAAYLTQLADLHEPDEFAGALNSIAKGGAQIMVDPGVAPHAIKLMIEAAGGKIIAAADPARLPRASKNKAEIAASANVHKQDGVAMVRFLRWFDAQPEGSMDEISAASALENFRASTANDMQMPLMALSFDTISGAGPDAAIIHYRVNTATNRPIKAGEMYLVDSGGQYISGTTDITRTIAVGAVPDEQKRFFTRVLKGMIAISQLRFPTGTRGLDIDAFARVALWKAGADYAHGTGHGVGSFLAVHEGPQSISRRGSQELLPGMIVSNEPGYYRDGAFGIRIENLVYIHEPRDIDGGDHPMLGFVTLTLCPIDRRLIVVDLLDVSERDWLDTYHQRVRTEIMPLLSEQADRNWLDRATAPL